MNTRRWYFPLCILLATCFGVFLLPFLLPPPYLAGISAANVAGYNNKVKLHLRRRRWEPWSVSPRFDGRHGIRGRRKGDFGKIPNWVVITTAILCGCLVALPSYLGPRFPVNTMGTGATSSGKSACMSNTAADSMTRSSYHTAPALLWSSDCTRNSISASRLNRDRLLHDVGSRALNRIVACRVCARPSTYPA